MRRRSTAACLFIRALLCRSLNTIAVVALASASVFAQQSVNISGVVLDAAGAAIENARVQLRIGEHMAETRTDGSGHFQIAVSSFNRSGNAALVISAHGFSTKRVDLLTLDSPALEVRLEPAAIVARIEVAPPGKTSQVEGEILLSHAVIARSGALVIDDALRQVPGFSLFRRSGSLTANPTSQGVSLRGVGANGASRALVLLDGVPLNSPFGSWIYWNRVPRVGIESVNVINGATSDAYGSGALGGVINIQTQQVEEPSLEADLSFGNEATAAASVVGGTVVHNLGITASAQAVRTKGYVLVNRDNRGAVDTPAGTADVSGYVTISRALPDAGRVFLRANTFGESRRNGTPIQINDTRIWSLDLGIDRRIATLGDLSARVYGSREIFNQNFSAVAIDRNSESLTNRQRNPSQQLGIAVQWQRLFAARHLIVAGFESRFLRGHSAELTFNASRITANIDAGGRQSTVAGFMQDSVRIHRWMFNFGGRFDRWSDRGFSNRIPVSGAATFTGFPGRVETAFSPRASISRDFGAGFQITGAVYRGFRAPTLNELYRGFRVGNVVTNANSDLRAERLTGGEAGVTFQALSERITTRAKFFWGRITDPVANVTIASTLNLITRQRQNLGTVRARGVEAAADFRIGDTFNVAAQYLLTDTTVIHFPPNRTLEGLLVPQIPRHQLFLQFTYSTRRWVAAVQARFVGAQFDDDQNLLPLRRFFTLDSELSRKLSQRFEVYFASQNLTGVRYEVSRTPVLSTGPPAQLRAGLRVTLR